MNTAQEKVFVAEDPSTLEMPVPWMTTRIAQWWSGAHPSLEEESGVLQRVDQRSPWRSPEDPE